MGVVFLEVLCCTKILTKTVLSGFASRYVGAEADISIGAVRDFFEQPDCVSGFLEEHLRLVLNLLGASRSQVANRFAAIKSYYGVLGIIRRC